MNYGDLLSLVNNHFRYKEFSSSSMLDSYVDGAVDSLVNEFKPLSFFQPYLKSHFKDDFRLTDENLGNSSIATIDTDSKNEVMAAVREFVRSKIPTTLILADPSYSGIDSYRHLNKVDLSR